MMFMSMSSASSSPMQTRSARSGAKSDCEAPRLQELTEDAALRFDIDPLTGFMPSEEPIRRLSGLGACWEDAWDASEMLELHAGDAAASRWRRKVEMMPVRHDISFLTNARLLRRARAVLVYLAHRYCFCVPASSDPEVVPEVCDSIAVPLMKLCKLLSLPPVITYADASYNWRFIDPQKGYVIENLDVSLSFTGSRSEAHFMLVPLFIEHAGAPALKLMALVLDELSKPSPSHDSIASELTELARIIDACTTILATMSPTCVPQHFYYIQRPWFMGGPRRLIGKVEDWGGASAGQSTLIHAFDVFLSVDHTPRAPEEGGFEATFMHRMSAYMPAPHRAYLIELAKVAPVVRAFARANEDTQVAEAYNLCVDALRKLREGHMRIVNSYIVRFARADAKKLAQQAHATDEEVEAKGTGGTNLVQFLRLTRERTLEARIADD